MSARFPQGFHIRPQGSSIATRSGRLFCQTGGDFVFDFRSQPSSPRWLSSIHGGPCLIARCSKPTS